MLKLFEKRTSITENRKFYDENAVLRYKIKVKSPFSVGTREIQLFDGDGKFLGVCLEDDSKAQEHNNISFFRRFILSDREAALLEGCLTWR